LTETGWCEGAACTERPHSHHARRLRPHRYRAGVGHHGGHRARCHRGHHARRGDR
jgi:hypothetical protein